MGFLDTLGANNAPTTDGGFLGTLGQTPPVPAAPSLSQQIPGNGQTLSQKLAAIPSQTADAVTHIFPGAQIGNAISNDLAGPVGAVTPLLQGNPKLALDTVKVGLANAAKENGANAGKIVGDAVQAVTLPASFALGAGDIAPSLASKGVGPALARVAVNGVEGAGLTGGATAAAGGNAQSTTESSALGFAGGAGLSAGAEGIGALKGVINGSTEPYSAALKQVTPDYETATPTQKANLIDQHTATNPRIQEGGVIGGRSVIPNATEKASAAEVAKIPGYKPNATALQTHTLIQGEISKQGDALTTSLKNEKIIVPKQEISSIISKATADVPNESTLIARGDAPLANYIRAAKASVADNDGTLSGVLQVRKDLDAAYENARGKLAYNSDKIAPLDQIHQEARNALNDYLASHAQNTDVKAALKSQSLLYKADDVIRAKAAKEGGSALDRVRTAVKNHPLGAAISGSLTALGADKVLKATTGVGI